MSIEPGKPDLDLGPYAKISTGNEVPMSNSKYIPNSDKDFKLGTASPHYGNSQDGNPDTPDVPVTGTNIDPYLTAGAGVIMAIGGAFLVPKGYISASALAQIVSAILSLGAMGFLAYKGTTKAKVVSLARTINVPKAKLASHIVSLKNTYAASRQH